METAQTNRKTWWESIRACSGTAADRRNQRRFAAWMLGWSVAIVGALRILRTSELGGVVVWLVALAPSLLALMALGAFLRFLREADELVRRIQMEGLAIGFGVGLIVAVGYAPFQVAGGAQIDALDAVVPMMLGWVAGQLIATWRYR